MKDDQEENREPQEATSWIGKRSVYGIGTVAIFARLDAETHRVILEQRDREKSTSTTLHTADEVQRLTRFLIMALEHRRSS